MDRNSLFKENSNEDKLQNNFNVVIMGNYDKQEKIFSNTFPVLLNNSSIKHKYINRYILSIRERHIFPKDFLNIYHPEIIDKFMKIDILILTFNKSDKISFEYLKTFYHLYYTKLEETDKPKNIIIMERDYTEKGKSNNEEKVDSNSIKEITNLFNSYFCDYKADEEKLTQVLNECLNNLLQQYNYIDDYSSFKYKELNKEIDSYVLVYGDKSSQNTFVDILLKSECNFQYKKIKDNFYEIKYEKILNDKELSFKITLKLVNSEYLYDSECNILLYDINNNESFNSLKTLIRYLIKTNGPKFKKIYQIFSLNSATTHISEEEENNEKIKEGKILAYEIGANFSVINTNNNNNLGKEIKIKFDNFLDIIVDYIKMSKITTNREDNTIPTTTFINIKDDKNVEESDNKNSPANFISDIKDKIENKLKECQYCLYNICPNCYSQLSIRINEQSNIIIYYCDKCKSNPKGLSIEQFFDFNKKNFYDYHCKFCKNPFNFNFNTKKLDCKCNSIRFNKTIKIKNADIGNKKYIAKNVVESIQIPIYLKDCYCHSHKLFHQSYLKYSKKGLCDICCNQRLQKNFFVEKFNEDKINKLIDEQKAKLEMEKEYISKLQNEFDECINALRLKFEKNIGKKIKKHILKSDLIKTIQIIQNNDTLLSNVKSLKFDKGDKFNFKEKDTIENKLKNIFKSFNYEEDIDNLYFENKNYLNSNVQIKGPYNSLYRKEEVTDIWGLKKNDFICVSFKDGQAKIYNSKQLEKNEFYPICTIKESRINSLFVSQNESNIWKKNSYNKNDIIYLNGYEEIKIIQMDDDYENYNELYVIKQDLENISHSIELDNNKILSLNVENHLNLISFMTEDNNEIKDKKENVDGSFIDIDQTVLSLGKIKENIIYLNVTNENELKFKEFKEENEDEFQRTMSISEPNVNINKEEQNIEIYSKIYSKIFSIQIINDKVEIMKVFTFSENYKLIGCLSEEKNLLLLKYIEINKKNKNENLNMFSIFDYNINQFIFSFKINESSFSPKLLKILNFGNDSNIQGFIMIDQDLNIAQYLYDESFEKKIYFIYNIEPNGNKNNQLKGLINLIKQYKYI